ncbi:hypothetical protein K1T71_013705 [Dendrolimus kikuchii]|uniref:Uncharacterized protein n=1 Tax=Dendrolimus kikuchii TaxID=765133 RepID=A0ACC1CH58_9NEOP|nr:hypothetical protein K1T71_013705 [Dendrolimus kikuchii]
MCILLQLPRVNNVEGKHRDETCKSSGRLPYCRPPPPPLIEGGPSPVVGRLWAVIIILLHADKSECTPACHKQSLIVLIDLKIFTSSAYKRKFENLKQLFISLIKIVNKSGPSRDPWGTPEGIFTHLEEYPLTTTACDLLSI